MPYIMSSHQHPHMPCLPFPQVYVSAAKRAVMDCLELAPEYRALITSDHLETNIHAVSCARDGWKEMHLGMPACSCWHAATWHALL